MQPQHPPGWTGHPAPGKRLMRRSRSPEPGCKTRTTGFFGRMPGTPGPPRPGEKYTVNSSCQETTTDQQQTFCVCVCVFNHLPSSSHQQHEVIEPFAGLFKLHRADPGSLEGLVVGRQRDVHRVRVGQQERNTHPLYTQTHSLSERGPVVRFSVSSWRPRKAPGGRSCPLESG